MMPPDGFVGAVLAVESFSDMKVLLHGPIGCRRDLSFISSILCPKDPKGDPPAYRCRYYQNDPRVPCTEVEAEDYIGGAIARLEDALNIVSRTDDDYIAVVSTPGVSLIGDSCEDAIERLGLSDHALAIDADYISIPLGDGYDRTLVRILRWLNPKQGNVRPRTVNILGMSVFMRDWKAVLDDLTELLEALGLHVICTPGVSCSTESFLESVNAEFNIAVCHEYCGTLERVYSEEYNIPCIDMHEAPVGFDALRRWVAEISRTCSVDPSPAMRIIDRTVSRAYGGMRSSRSAGSLKGRSLGIAGDATVVLPLVKWLYNYLGIIPVLVDVTEGSDEIACEELKTFLKHIGCLSALKRNDPNNIYVMAADGDSVRRMELGRICTVGLDIGYPSLYDSNFMRKNVIGHNGALYILERIVNSRPMMSM